MLIPCRDPWLFTACSYLESASNLHILLQSTTKYLLCDDGHGYREISRYKAEVNHPRIIPQQLPIVTCNVYNLRVYVSMPPANYSQNNLGLYCTYPDREPAFMYKIARFREGEVIGIRGCHYHIPGHQREGEQRGLPINSP